MSYIIPSKGPWSINPEGAQLVDLAKKTQKKVKPHLKAWPSPLSHALCIDSGLSLEQRWKRRFLSCQCGGNEEKEECPQIGPWHHAGATMEITLDWKWILNGIRRELNPMHAKSDTIVN